MRSLGPGVLEERCVSLAAPSSLDTSPSSSEAGAETGADGEEDVDDGMTSASL